MSIAHYISIELFAPCTAKNINHLLQSGLDNNLRYFEYYFEKPSNSHAPLSSSEGTKILLTPDEEDYGGPYLKTKVNDSWFFLRIHESEKGLISLYVSPFSAWQIEFEDILHIDFARYIELMLKICKDFTIINIKTESF